MNIGIDARLYGLEHAGIGRYVMNLVNRLISSDLPVQWTVFTAPNHVKELSQHAHVQVVETSVRHYSVAEQTSFLGVVNRHHLDLFHVPHFNVPLGYTKPFIVTIHDILWHQVRGGSVTTLSPFIYYLKYLGYQMTVRHAVTKAAAIIVPSNFVKTDLCTTFPSLPEDKITVTYEGVDVLKTATKTTPSIEKPYILYVGSAYPHKNLVVVFRALQLMRKNDYPDLKLVIVGSRSVFLDRVQQQVEAMGLTKAVIFAGYKSDSDVVALMQHALCVVTPSKSEGFGLTGLEAMQAGTPVIAARATALPEIYGDAALFFNPDDEGGLVCHLTTLLTKPAVRDQLIAAGSNRINDFSWEKMVAQTIAVYRNILAI